jgi:hypothetical protein
MVRIDTPRFCPTKRRVGEDLNACPVDEDDNASVTRDELTTVVRRIFNDALTDRL